MFWYSRHCVCSLLSFIQHQQHQQQYYNDLKWQQNMRFFLFSVAVDTRELKWKLRMEMILLVCSVFFLGVLFWFHVVIRAYTFINHFKQIQWIWIYFGGPFTKRLNHGCYSSICDKTAKLTKLENIAFCETTIHISRSLNKYRYSIHFPLYLLP